MVTNIKIFRNLNLLVAAKRNGPFSAGNTIGLLAHLVH